MYVDPDPPEVPPLNPNDPEYPPQMQPHAILDSLPFSVFCPFRHTCMWTLTPEVPPLNPNDPEYPPQMQPHAILDSLPFSVFCPFDIHMYVTLTPEVPPLNPNDPEYPPQKQPHAILDSLPFSVFLPLSTYTCMWTLTLPKCLRSTPMTPNTPHRCNHTRSLTLCPFPFSALSTYMYVDPDPPKCLRSTPMTPNTLPPLNPNDPEYPPQMQPHAILDSLPFSVFLPLSTHMYVDPDPPKCLRSTPMTPEYPPQMQPHAILDSLPFSVFCPFRHTYVDPDPEVPPLNPNDPEYPPQMQPHAILDSLPFPFSALSTYTCMWTLTLPKCLPKSKPPDSSIKIELSCPKPFSFLPAPNPFDRLTKLNK
ncbi:hypothetical protein PAPYR_7094 [Paratrimastix pyriformis]|uniref:Uncharacterized protein n=1 Tax=Paratrimastix pyriformis TaxID=342808 RepID=A0ABQ8UKU8_9EUKA|nr:hypothetical protein PAPYR_7094 [Paratrimastix pyriformis]